MFARFVKTGRGINSNDECTYTEIIAAFLVCCVVFDFALNKGRQIILTSPSLYFDYSYLLGFLCLRNQVNYNNW